MNNDDLIRQQTVFGILWSAAQRGAVPGRDSVGCFEPMVADGSRKQILYAQSNDNINVKVSASSRQKIKRYVDTG